MEMFGNLKQVKLGWVRLRMIASHRAAYSWEVPRRLRFGLRGSRWYWARSGSTKLQAVAAAQLFHKVKVGCGRAHFHPSLRLRHSAHSARVIIQWSRLLPAVCPGPPVNRLCRARQNFTKRRRLCLAAVETRLITRKP